MIKRIIKNIKWAIFNHPPTATTQMTKEETAKYPCSYCGSYINLQNYVGGPEGQFCICWTCLKKVYASILLPKPKKQVRKKK